MWPSFYIALVFFVKYSCLALWLYCYLAFSLKNALIYTFMQFSFIFFILPCDVSSLVTLLSIFVVRPFFTAHIAVVSLGSVISMSYPLCQMYFKRKLRYFTDIAFYSSNTFGTMLFLACFAVNAGIFVLQRMRQMQVF